MRKLKPVLILLVIQLVIAITLPLIKPVSDLVIRTWGEEYIIDISHSDSFVIYGVDEPRLVGRICYNPDYDIYYNFDNCNYAVIEPDENGLYRISELVKKKPEGKSYLGGINPGGYMRYIRYEQALSQELIDADSNSENPLFNSYSDKEQINPDYKITARIFIFKGKARLDTFLVDGVEIEKFLGYQAIS